MKHGHNVVRDKVLETLTAFPNITTNEIVDLIPECTRVTLQSTISKLHKRGILMQGPYKVDTRGDGMKYSFRTYAVNPSAVKKLLAPKKPKQASVLTDAGLNARLEELKAKVQELETWKEQAIERFPDLAVAPLLLKARKIVAEETRASGDGILANHIMAGHKDATMLVRVTLKALEEAYAG